MKGKGRLEEVHSEEGWVPGLGEKLKDNDYINLGKLEWDFLSVERLILLYLHLKSFSQILYSKGKNTNVRH